MPYVDDSKDRLAELAAGKPPKAHPIDFIEFYVVDKRGKPLYNAENLQKPPKVKRATRTEKYRAPRKDGLIPGTRAALNQMRRNFELHKDLWGD